MTRKTEQREMQRHNAIFMPGCVGGFERSEKRQTNQGHDALIGEFCKENLSSWHCDMVCIDGKGGHDMYAVQFDGWRC